MKEILIDIETYSEVDIGKCGLYRYATDPSTEILLIAWATDDGSGFGETQCADLATGDPFPQELLDAFKDSNVMVTFFACVAIGIISCMPFCFKLLVNEQFNDAYELVPFYLIAVFFNAVIGLISAIYLVKNETKQVAVSTMVAAIINIVVDVLLIGIIGAYAAPISSIAGYATISFWRLYDVNKRHCKITMPRWKIGALIGLLLVSLFGFYSDHLAVSIIALCVVIIGALALNKNLLLYLVKEQNK